MDMPKRKPNRLQNYDYSQQGAYFITVCVKDRKRVLCDIVGDDAHIVPKKCGIILEKYIQNVPEIEKYVIMPDHFHFVLKIENGTMWASSPTKKVSSIVRSIKTLTTKEIGRSIFQRSYFDHIIRNENDYSETLKYIENNPMRWLEKHNHNI